MVRMIEFSSEKVSGNTWEAMCLVGFLLVFALTASGYVLKKGLEQDRDQFDLLLHCILIVTSVIPPELNMQLALAVNASLLALIRVHVFCTEPYRIPLAGKVDVCLFDKTGTITTDELVASSYVDGTKDTKVPIHKSPLPACIVMAGCHSLVQYDDEVVGDPLETAALRAIRWQFDHATGTSMPKAAAAAVVTDATAAPTPAAAATATAAITGPPQRNDYVPPYLK